MALFSASTRHIVTLPRMKKRILLVEDDSAMTRILRDNLLYEGFEVERVADGNLVLAKAKEFGPDLVVLDIMLPGISGFELCTSLRQRGRLSILTLVGEEPKGGQASRTESRGG